MGVFKVNSEILCAKDTGYKTDNWTAIMVELRIRLARVRIRVGYFG